MGKSKCDKNVKPKGCRMMNRKGLNSVCGGWQVENAEVVGGTIGRRATPIPGQHHHPAGSEGLSAWL